MTNPFEAYGIDPRDGPAAITERFRELLEDAATDDEKERLRAAWEELTLHPARRLRAAFGAHPGSSAPALRAAAPEGVGLCAILEPSSPAGSVKPTFPPGRARMVDETGGSIRFDPILFPPRK